MSAESPSGSPARSGKAGKGVGRRDSKGKIRQCLTTGEQTHPSITPDSSSPEGRSVNDAKVFLHTKRTTRWFRDHVCHSRFCSLYLDETLCTDCLVTTTRTIDIGRIILRRSGSDRFEIVRFVKEQTRKHIGHSAASLYIAASALRGSSFDTLRRLWWVDLTIGEVASLRDPVGSCSTGRGGSLRAARICSSSHEGSYSSRGL